jgi:hypothetical protein
MLSGGRGRCRAETDPGCRAPRGAVPGGPRIVDARGIWRGDDDGADWMHQAAGGRFRFSGYDSDHAGWRGLYGEGHADNRAVDLVSKSKNQTKKGH